MTLLLIAVKEFPISPKKGNFSRMKCTSDLSLQLTIFGGIM